MSTSRHLTTAGLLLSVGSILVAILAGLAWLGVDAAALEAVAGVVTTLILTVGGATSVSAGRHIGEGFRPPNTPGV